MPDQHLLEVTGLKKYFPVRKGLLRRITAQIKAVDGIDLAVKENETLGLVGESGCGKTTTGRSILRLIEPTSGRVLFRSKLQDGPGSEGKKIDLRTASPRQLKSLRREIQIIFQDPYSSLNPRKTVAATVGEPLRLHHIVRKADRMERVRELLSAVGLSPEHMNRYPHEFSGGQRQRVGIARALALEPRLIVADEPVSALDVSIQAQIVNLMKDLQIRYGLTYLFISHDLSIIKYISDRVAVMYLGKIVEMSSTRQLFENPMHPYSEALMSAVPIPNPRLSVKRIELQGDVPSPMKPPAGCHFHPRCRYVQEICRNEFPLYADLGDGHHVACHLAEKLHLRPAALFSSSKRPD